VKRRCFSASTKFELSGLLLHLDSVCLERKTVDRCRVRAAKFEVDVGLRIPDGVHLVEQLPGVSGIAEAHKLLAIADLNLTLTEFLCAANIHAESVSQNPMRLVSGARCGSGTFRALRDSNPRPTD
jgi:hypothetical protein